MGYKLLVVDDDKEIIETFKNRLAKEGYDCAFAYDGEEALVRVREDNPDIILLDLMMPKLNGFDVLKEVREKHKDKWRPVIIISAQNELDSMKKCYDLEADHYLTKPCTLDDVLRGIRTMISLIPMRTK